MKKNKLFSIGIIVLIVCLLASCATPKKYKWKSDPKYKNYQKCGCR